MSHAATEPFPRTPLLGAAALVLLAVVAVASARLLGAGGPDLGGTARAERALRFEDEAGGGITVRDARDGAPVAVVEPGSNGFLRATLRGLARERLRQGVGAELPFRLTAWADGRLTLEDPVTRRLVDLGAFGQTNAAAFARLLAPHGASE